MVFATLNIENVDTTEFLRISTPYAGAQSLVEARKVVDIGSGPGYGAYLLAAGRPASLVVCDLNPDRLPAPPARALIGDVAAYARLDAARLPYRNQCVDMVTLFEVIEHVPDPSAVLREIRRVLAVNGVVLMSTPNRGVRLLRFEKPWNSEHLVEYTVGQFGALCEGVFPVVELLGIYGVGGFQDEYLDRWHPTIRRWAQREVRPMIGRSAVGRAVKAVLRRSPIPDAESERPADGSAGPRSAAESGPKSPDPELSISSPSYWPFAVRDYTDHCLSTVAVCGADPFSVRQAARAFVDAYRWGGEQEGSTNCQ